MQKNSKKIAGITQNRSLKIQPHIRLNKYSRTEVPEIKLKGNWLQKLGFCPHQRVNITTKNKLLIIRIAD